MTATAAAAELCTTCAHKKYAHQLQPRPVLCRECQDETRGTRNTKATHVFRGKDDLK